jgi:DNA-binding MarR family transcriptional regulator
MKDEQTQQTSSLGTTQAAREARRRRHYDSADANDKLVIELREIGHLLRGLSEGKGSQKRVVIELGEMGTVTQRELTEQLGIQPGSASEVIAKLEEQGLLARTENEKDRRTANVSLTEAGVAACKTYKAERAKRNAQMFSCLTEDEKRQLIALLERISDDWNARYPNEIRRGHRHGHHGGEYGKMRGE